MTESTDKPLDEHHGPERSFNGANAYYFECSVIGHRPSYFVCLHKNQVFAEKGALPEFAVECEKAIAAKRCVAAQMREEELLAGRSIYFAPRIQWMKPSEVRHREHPLPSLASLTRNAPPRAPGTRTTPSAAPKVPQQTVQNLDFAQVVTELAKTPVKEVPAEPANRPAVPPKEVAAPVAPPATKTAPAPAKAGESLLELARRMKQAKSSLTTD